MSQEQQLPASSNKEDGSQLFNKKYSCKKCQKQYDLQGTIINHNKKKHNGDKSLIQNNIPNKVGRPCKNNRQTKSSENINPVISETVQTTESHSEIPVDLKHFVSSHYYGKIITHMVKCQKDDDNSPQQSKKTLMDNLKNKLNNYCTSLKLCEQEIKQYINILKIIKYSIWPHIKQDQILDFSKDLLLAFISLKQNTEDNNQYILNQVSDLLRYSDFLQSFRKNNKTIFFSKSQINLRERGDNSLQENASNFQNAETFKMDIEEDQMVEQQQEQQQNFQTQQQISNQINTFSNNEQQQQNFPQENTFEFSNNNDDLSDQQKIVFSCQQNLLEDQIFFQSSQQYEMNEQTQPCSLSLENNPDESFILNKQENSEEPEFSNFILQSQQNEYQFYESAQSENLNNASNMKQQNKQTNHHHIADTV